MNPCPSLVHGSFLRKGLIAALRTIMSPAVSERNYIRIILFFPHLSGEGRYILCQLPRVSPPLLSSPLVSSRLFSSRLVSSANSGRQCSPPELTRQLPTAWRCLSRVTARSRNWKRLWTANLPNNMFNFRMRLLQLPRSGVGKLPLLSFGCGEITTSSELQPAQILQISITCFLVSVFK